MSAPLLVVRPREHTGERDWPWVLVDDASGEVYGDYPCEADALSALREATMCGRCGFELDRPDGRCGRCYPQVVR